jgi:predicted nicotinamide N-methyase
MKMKTAMTDKLTSCGVTLLLPSHKEIMKLRKGSVPTEHGHKVWPTTWLLIDYLKNSCNLKGKRVMDLACGWGLPGIFCAKTGNAKVTWIDTDEKVLPYLTALANENRVVPNFIAMDINRVGHSILKNIDIIIASDICFCDTLIDPIRRLINRAKKAKVQEIYISDPGRWPFEELADLFINKRNVELMDREITAPVSTHGKILKISF